MDVARFSSFGPRLHRLFRDGVECLEVRPRRSWKIIGLALIGVLFTMAKDYRGIADFLHERSWSADFAMAVAALLWLLWFLAFASEFFGTERISVERGELVVSRGIGPLRRTFRYQVGDIAELVSTGWVPLEEEDKPKGYAHHIFFKPKSGAVRFERDQDTVYFAETLDAAGGEALVRWLLPRLPRRAAELALGLGYRR
ncbi:MAG TPA: hypothetical protein VF079_03825 [Sphingomicrobium sp.]